MPLRNRKHFSVVFVVLTFIVLFATPEYGSLPVPDLRGQKKRLDPILQKFTSGLDLIFFYWVRFRSLKRNKQEFKYTSFRSTYIDFLFLYCGLSSRLYVNHKIVYSTVCQRSFGPFYMLSV